VESALDAELHRLRVTALRRLAERCGLAVTPARAEELARTGTLAQALDELEAQEARRFRRRRAAEDAQAR
jgi:hypothetical protein